MAPRRHGFTLVETLVALVLFEFAMLALTAAIAVAARDLATARRLDRAHGVARNRVELLAAQSCPAVGGATAPAGSGLTEFWRVQGAGAERRITDSVVWTTPRGGRGHVVARATVLCGP